METISYLFGHGLSLTPMQMSLRAVVVSFCCLVLLRFSGRRSFALGTPIDNVLAILLGAILSRAVTGASPFFSTLAAAATIAVLHRVISWLGMRSSVMGRIFKGVPKVVYRNGKLNEKNMRYCRITRRDIMAGVRQSLHQNTLENIHSIYVERNGRISVIANQNTIHEKVGN
jgi:uncharacterized membrane protein YcaP (DUF421 family)